MQLASDCREGLLSSSTGSSTSTWRESTRTCRTSTATTSFSAFDRMAGVGAHAPSLLSAGRDELDSLSQPGLANGVFSKLDPFDELIAQVSAERLGANSPLK